MEPWTRYDIPLEGERFAQMWLPDALTKADAARLGEIVMALAVNDEDAQ